MQKLIEAGLIGDGLVTVDSPAMVDRYNQALEESGVSRTQLTAFTIDGIGWSPEVATECNNRFYLSVGLPNQVGIILSPDQEGKPIYFPFRSFDRDLMSIYFKRFAQEIADVTRRSPIVLDIDQGVTDYETPLDLLLTNQFVVHSSAGKLAEEARVQQDIVGRFMADDETWFDTAIRQQLIDSGKQHGDLRYRKVTIPDMRYDDVRDFYTRAFGGAYLFRSHGGPEILVLEDASLVSQTKRRGVVVYTTTSTKALDQLRDCGLIDIDLAWYRDHPEQLQHLYDSLVGDFLCRERPEMVLDDVPATQRKKLLLSLKASAPPAIFDLERLMKKLKSDSQALPTVLSTDLQHVLMHPAATVLNGSRRVIWQLLAGYQPWNVSRQYFYRRNEFVEQIANWPEPMQSWAIELIQRRYRRVMDQQKEQ